MTITLWQLNESYQALVKLAQSDFPKDQHRLAYKLSRVLKSAKAEIEVLGESLTDLQKKCGMVPGEEVKPEVLADYNAQGKDFMRGTIADLWGDPIRLDDIGPVVPISPFDLALLDWLIVEDEEQPSAAKAATT